MTLSALFQHRSWSRQRAFLISTSQSTTMETVHNDIVFFFVAMRRLYHYFSNYIFHYFPFYILHPNKYPILDSKSGLRSHFHLPTENPPRIHNISHVSIFVPIAPPCFESTTYTNRSFISHSVGYCFPRKRPGVHSCQQRCGSESFPGRSHQTHAHST